MRTMTSMAVASLAIGWAVPAAATVRSIQIDSLVDTEPAGQLRPQDSLLIRGFVRKATGAVSNTVPFKAQTAAIDVVASWLVGTDFRLIGVNIDLVDRAGTVIASDDFQGLLGGHAVSKLSFTGLVPGRTYRIVLTGTAQAASVYTIAVSTP